MTWRHLTPKHLPKSHKDDGHLHQVTDPKVRLERVAEAWPQLKALKYLWPFVAATAIGTAWVYSQFHSFANGAEYQQTKTDVEVMRHDAGKVEARLGKVEDQMSKLNDNITKALQRLDDTATSKTTIIETQTVHVKKRPK